MEIPENRKTGGERGIRTLDRVSPIHAFQACAFNHSAISPGSRGLEVSIATLLIDDRSVAFADFVPAAVQSPFFFFFETAVGIFGSELLVHFDSPARGFVDVNVPIFQGGATPKDF